MPQSLRTLASALHPLISALRHPSLGKFAQKANMTLRSALNAFTAIASRTSQFQLTIIRAAALLCAQKLRACAASFLVSFWLAGSAVNARFSRFSGAAFANAFAHSGMQAARAGETFYAEAVLAAHSVWRVINRTRAVLHASMALFAAVALVSAFALGGDSMNAGAAPIKRVTPRTETNAPRETASGAFIDRFTRLDETRWYVADRGSNGSWSSNDFPRRNVAITPEGLVLTMSRNPEGSPTPYSGAEISTHAQYEYGYFEARMRTPRGGGLVSGVFTFARPGGSESWHEIDIEILGRNPRQMEVARWFKGHSNGGARKPLWFDSSEDFHTYGFEWTPGAVRWYVDNHLVEETGTDQQPIPHGPQNLVINLWISRKMRSWVGEINPDEAPWRLTVSCVAQAARYTGRTLCPDR